MTTKRPPQASVPTRPAPRTRPAVAKEAPRKRAAVAKEAPRTRAAGASQKGVLVKRPPVRRRFPSLLAELKSLGERGGAVLGDAYALLSGSVLSRLEELEDAHAERRYRRAEARRAQRASAPIATSSTESSLTPTKNA